MLLGEASHSAWTVCDKAKPYCSECDTRSEVAREAHQVECSWSNWERANAFKGFIIKSFHDYKRFEP